MDNDLAVGVEQLCGEESREVLLKLSKSAVLEQFWKPRAVGEKRQVEWERRQNAHWVILLKKRLTHYFNVSDLREKDLDADMIIMKVRQDAEQGFFPVGL